MTDICSASALQLVTLVPLFEPEDPPYNSHPSHDHSLPHHYCHSLLSRDYNGELLFSRSLQKCVMLLLVYIFVLFCEILVMSVFTCM